MEPCECFNGWGRRFNSLAELQRATGSEIMGCVRQGWSHGLYNIDPIDLIKDLVAEYPESSEDEIYELYSEWLCEEEALCSEREFCDPAEYEDLPCPMRR